MWLFTTKLRTIGPDPGQTGMKFSVLLLLISLSSQSVSVAAQQVFRSADRHTTLVELYTSEGCSSCPPADRWFSSLVDDPGLFQTFIPVAFHVDYWNYLGWEDRFASPHFAERQRQYKQQGSVNGVYTPGVMASGQEWRSWRRHPGQIPAGEAQAGLLELAVAGRGFEARLVNAPAVAAHGPLALNVAVLGFGLASSVAAGENSGRQLQHDFVVLGHRQYLASDLQWASDLPPAQRADEAQRLAVVAWVSPVDRQQPLQAVGGWLRD